MQEDQSDLQDGAYDTDDAWFPDEETGDRFLVDTTDPRVRGRFARHMQAQREERRKLFKKLELDHVELRAGDDHGKALAQFFRGRPGTELAQLIG